MFRSYTYIQNTKPEKHGIHVTEIGNYNDSMPESDPNYDLDPYYLKGCIEIVFDGKYLFTKENSFDYVLPFWHTLMNLGKQILYNRKSIENYPGSPINIILSQRGHKFADISLKMAHEKKAFNHITVKKSEFFQALHEGAERFFRLMPAIHPVGRGEYERSLIELQELRLVRSPPDKE